MEKFNQFNQKMWLLVAQEYWDDGISEESKECERTDLRLKLSSSLTWFGQVIRIFM